MIMPALNEEANIDSAVARSLKAFEDCRLQGEVLVVDDGSGDRTPERIQACMAQDARVRVLAHAAPQGIGASFWDGVSQASGRAVVYIPGDDESDPGEILRYYPLLERVDIVIPFIINREARPLFRRVLSSLYGFIVRFTWRIRLRYTNGTFLIRRSVLDEFGHHSRGFFFQVEILVRAIQRGHPFTEVPCRLGRRRTGASKAFSWHSLAQVVRDYLRLLREQNFFGRSRV